MAASSFPPERDEPTDESGPREDIVEILELRYGSCGFYLLDSDDIERMIAEGEVRMPPMGASNSAKSKT